MEFVNGAGSNQIHSIEIDGLFGEHDFRLKADPYADPRILILYGQNGSGKTTALKLIQSLLAPNRKGGLRTWLSRLAFKRVSIELGGFVVEALRKDELIGQYRWVLRKDKIEIASITIKPRNGRVNYEEWDVATRERYDDFVRRLGELIQVTYFDDRRTFFETKSGEVRWRHRTMPDGSIERVAVLEGEEDGDPVRIALNEFANSVRREVITRGNMGSQGAQSIYASLVERISSSVGSPEILAADSVGSLIEKLNGQQNRSESLAKYGLVVPVDHEDMLSSIDRAGQENAKLLATVLEPYVESLSARFDALDVLQKAIDDWITTLSDFFNNKLVRFRVGDEVQVISRSTGDPLSVGSLSSGERHLLLLMTKAFLMRNTGGLLLIDEPELSLNVGWQRRLMGSLLQSFRSTTGQIIVASHSLEIVSQYSENVVDMIPYVRPS